MSITEDLINFDIIETHKENIQSLPGGRSAKALASAFAPRSLFSPVPTPGETRNLNDTIRQEYELEIIAISDSDDPLDIYDRYVKWTLNAYPSTQATPESQLRPLLERATKAFQAAAHYKNDPRYLKLWLTYIRLFSDAPRETFAYLARHNIGEGLALFYEEFAAWLEGAGRWSQAEEVYKLGIEREARPTERLLRKFGEFQHRFEQRPRDADEPSSPALPTIRPALVAKLDPFASSTPVPTDPQASRLASAVSSSSTSRSGRQKIAIFSDADAPASNAKLGLGETSKGWDNIGSIKDRKKENTMEARPWVGETLKAGKKIGAAPKLMVFKDASVSTITDTNETHFPALADQQQVPNPKTGKIDRVFVNLEAVYPNRDNPNEEYSFEELRAKSRGWLEMRWAKEQEEEVVDDTGSSAERYPLRELPEFETEELVDLGAKESKKKGLTVFNDENEHISRETVHTKEAVREVNNGRLKKMKVMEVKGETQTRPKLKRKNSAEPTMTLHTRAATDDILDIFNQPLRNLGPIGSHPDSGGESDYDDDDYTSAGESTGTGRVSTTTDIRDNETGIGGFSLPEVTEARSVGEWSDFTSSKHIPNGEEIELDENIRDCLDKIQISDRERPAHNQDEEELVTPVSPKSKTSSLQPKFVPIPPEDYDAPVGPYRDALQLGQNRLPFMTPIVEKTESSMVLPTGREEKDYFSSKTPSRRKGEKTPTIPDIDDVLLSSPFQEIVNDASVDRQNVRQVEHVLKPETRKIGTSSKKPAPRKEGKGPIIKDLQCNPVDESIRKTILDNLQVSLSTYDGFHDYRPQTFNKAPEIRKFIKALAKVSKNASERTTTNLSIPPTIRFPHPSSKPYTIKRELGKGAFAPVYLAEQVTTGNNVNDDEYVLVEPSSLQDSRNPLQPRFSAIKCESPPTPWEFYIMSTAHRRLGLSRATESLAKPYGMHLFADEGYLIEEYRDQGTLLDLVNIARADTSSSSNGVLDEAVVMFFTIELLRTVEALHSQGLLHGDLKADNCLVRLKPSLASSGNSSYSPTGANGWSSLGLLLIDFGRGIDLRCFSPTVQFIADWKTGTQDCAEMREMRPWTWQVDYWGVAAIVHLLLFGKWIEDVVEKPTEKANGCEGDGGVAGALGTGAKRYRLKEGLKRYWQVELWTAFFETLMNPGRVNLSASLSKSESESEGGSGSGSGSINGSVNASANQPVWQRLRPVRTAMESWLEREGDRRDLRGKLRRLEE
ncbi:MAG: hypothetical protein Q9187_005774, partial [Circinaria calcarea]